MHLRGKRNAMITPKSPSTACRLLITNDLILSKSIVFSILFLISLGVSLLPGVDAALGSDLQVVYAINAGGYDHTDKHGISYDSDPLTVGTASDYGNNLLIIGRVPEQDEVLYRTERYHTATFGYDIPLEGDGEYALVLKFCEVYFNEPNRKIFNVVLNRRHEVVSNLDIFSQVGRGTAHEEYVYFRVTRSTIRYNNEVSEIRNNMVRLDFIKGSYDNPKVNAFVLFKGDVTRIPKLPPLQNENPQIEKDEFDDMFEDKLPDDKANANDYKKEKLSKRTAEKFKSEHQKNKESESNAEEDDVFEETNDDNDELDYLLQNKRKNLKTSGPRQPNPYQSEESMVLMPVFIAIGCFIPLLFCLCKL